LGTTRTSLAGAGTQTAGLGFGGYVQGTGNSGATEEYDGSTWTSGGSMATARRTLAGTGIQTAGLASWWKFVISRAQTNAVEEYDGATWTGGGNLPTATRDLAAAGTHYRRIYRCYFNRKNNNY
jgi:hypothetical protein